MCPAKISALRSRQWWIQLCRQSWAVLRFFWGTVVVGLLLNGIISLIFLSQGTKLKTLFLGQALDWVSQNLPLTGLATLSLIVLTILAWTGSRQETSHISNRISPTSTQQSHDRFVRSLYSQYTRELALSLHGVALIALSMHERFDVTRSPSQTIFRQVDRTEHPLPAGTTILQAYDESGGGLLIIGEPGAGKSTLLLELALGLLQRAEQESSHPIPVIFNLSSWVNTQPPVDEWLVEELLLHYGVPRRLAQAWIQADQLLPLLDGLDEVKGNVRLACINAINVYRGMHFVSLVVCSRSQEYLALEGRLELPEAIMIQSLTREQIRAYLKGVARPMTAVRKALRTNQALLELMTTPLMLNVVTLAYHGKTVKDVPQTGLVAAQQQEIFAAYIKRMLEPQGIRGQYSSERTRHWLIWLAKRMQQQNQSIFYVEQLQDDWLEDDQLHRDYEDLAVKLPGIFIGMLVSVVVNTVLFGVSDMVMSIEYMLVGGLLGGLFSQGKVVQHQGKERVKACKHLQHLATALSAGGIIGICVGLTYGLLLRGGGELSLAERWLEWQPEGGIPTQMGIPMGDTGYGWADWLHDGLISGLSFGITATLLSVIIISMLNKGETIQKPAPGTTIHLWGKLRYHLFQGKHLRNGILVGLGSAMCYILTGILSGGQTIGVTGWTAVSIVYTLIDSLEIGLKVGLSSVILSALLVEMKSIIQPAELIIWSWSSLRRSLITARHLRNTLFVGLSVGLTFGLSNAQFFYINGRLDSMMGFGLRAGLFAGWLVGLSYWILIGLFQGVSSDTFDEKHHIFPNQGIYLSGRNGLFFGMISIFVIGIIYLLIQIISSISFMLFQGLGHGLKDGVIIMLSSGLLTGLLSGGLAWWRHYILRFLLWYSKSVPFSYPRFLDEAASCILLRKVGGGFSFIHPLFQDYFASLDTTTPSHPPS